MVMDFRVCNYTSDNKIGRPRIRLQLPRKDEQPSYERKGKFASRDWRRRRKLFYIALKLNYNFTLLSGRLIKTTTLNVIGLLNCPITKLFDNNFVSELVENRSYFKPITIEEIYIFIFKVYVKVSYVGCALIRIKKYF